MLLKKEDGTATASIFYIAYIKDDVADDTKRPLTFAFNGGPGSSSVWLQMGALGPKRVAMDSEGNALPAALQTGGQRISRSWTSPTLSSSIP